MGAEMVTSAAANKMLRQLQDEKDYLLSIDSESSTYTRVSGYDDRKPEYDYEDIIKNISEVNDKICCIKHAINRFNCTTMLPDLDITVDIALIQMAQLNKEKDRLDKMRKRLPVQRCKDIYRQSGSLVEYICINYDLDKVKGEEIFYELVGWADKDTLIMPQGKNSKIGDAEFIKQYGETTEFTYGCKPGECDAYVYRMTKTDEDGYVTEYPDWLVRYRCEQMGLKCVPKFEDFIYTTEEDMLERVMKYIDGADPIGKTHIREGVVVRIQNREKFKALKNKNINFKILEDIIKDTAAVPDIEEAQEVLQ